MTDSDGSPDPPCIGSEHHQTAEDLTLVRIRHKLIETDRERDGVRWTCRAAEGVGGGGTFLSSETMTMVTVRLLSTADRKNVTTLIEAKSTSYTHTQVLGEVR